MLFRFVTGAGIGGEYSAINSTIQELVPARVRGWTDLIINGSFWLGAAIGAASSIILLDSTMLPKDVGWRAGFIIGAALSIAIFFLRLWIPESPRWLITHGQADKAQSIVSNIERRLVDAGYELATGPHPKVRLRTRTHTPLREVAATLIIAHRSRTAVGLSLMMAQAFFYNAIFFTYALVLIDFYQIPSHDIGWYILPFAAGNFLGPLILGRLFDTLGRRQMIAFTYVVSGLLLATAGYLFTQELVTAGMLTIAWMIIFFFASAAASSAYLTVSETFPLEVRALAIAFFYAVGTGVGGTIGPWLFGQLIETGSRNSVFAGYALGATLMIVAGGIAWRWGVAAERKPLEEVARPLAIADDL
jgi:MFS family permease